MPVKWADVRKACLDGDVTKLEQLYNADKNALSLRDSILTPLHVAAMQGHMNVVDFLLNHPCQVNAVDDEDKTALHLAAETGYTEIVEKLLNKGADVNAQTRNGDTALHAATLNSQEDVVRVLLGRSCDITIRNKTKHLASDYAVNDDVRALFGGQQDKANERYAAASAEPCAPRQAWKAEAVPTKQLGDLTNRVNRMEIQQGRAVVGMSLVRRQSSEKHGKTAQTVLVGLVIKSSI